MLHSYQLSACVPYLHHVDPNGLQELLMHDALADRSQIVYDSYTPEQQLSIRRQLEKFIAAQVCNTLLIIPTNMTTVCGTARGVALVNVLSILMSDPRTTVKLCPVHTHNALREL